MIARPLPRSGPIPFSQALLHPQPALPPGGRPQSQWAHGPQLQRAPAEATQAGAPTAQATYCGQGVLSVCSSVTGRLYRFEGRGCTQAIDPRDSLVLARLADLQVQHTRRVSLRGRN